MSKISTGILIYRVNSERIEFLLGHPGGPFYKNKDDGSWSIPKGTVEKNESLLEAAKRELLEETGFSINSNDFIALDFIRNKSGKKIYCWGVEADIDLTKFKTKMIEIKYPKNSDNVIVFKELDQINWFNYEIASIKINQNQQAFLDRLIYYLNQNGSN